MSLFHLTTFQILLISLLKESISKFNPLIFFIIILVIVMLLIIALISIITYSIKFLMTIILSILGIWLVYDGIIDKVISKGLLGVGILVGEILFFKLAGK